MSEKVSRTKNTLINTSASIASQLLTIFLNFALRTVFIQILGLQYAGVSSVFSTVLTMLSLSELGFGTAIATSLYRPLHEKDVLLIQQLMDFYKKAYRIVALFILIVGGCLIPFLGYLIKDVPDINENLVAIYVFYIIKTAASYLMIYKTTLLKADQKLYVIKKLEMVCQTVRYIIEIIVLVIFGEFMTYLIIEVVATILENYILTRRAQKEYTYAFEKPAEKLPREKVFLLIKDVKGLSIYKLSGTIGNSIDTMLISGLINTSTVAILGNYTLIKSQIQKIIMQFFTALTPSVGNLATEKNTMKQEIVFDRLLYISFVLVNFCSTSMFVLFTPFIKVWLGEQYLLSQSIAFIIAFDFFLYILLQAIASFRTANGLFVKGQYRPLATAVINIVLSIVLIKRYGIFGTIMATVLARLLTQWYDPYLLYKHIFRDSFKKFYIKYWIYIVLFVSGAVFTCFISNMVSLSSDIVTLILKAMVCLTIPNLWVIMWTFKSQEFVYAKNLITTFLKK